MRIAYRWFRPEKKTNHTLAKIVCHGLGGHSKSVSVRPIIDEALNQGFDVFSIDWPYHGLSSVRFRAKPSLKDMVISLDKFVQTVSESGEYLHIDIIGHSMGSVFAICWGLLASANVEKVRHIIAMNPGFSKQPWYEKYFFKIIGKFTPFQYGHSFLTHSLEFTDDVETVEKRFQDPLELKYIQDAILIPLIDASDLIQKSNHLQQAVPVKIIWSENDPVIDVFVVRKLFEKANYECLYVTDAPFHELCSTTIVGEEVCKKAVYGFAEDPKECARSF